MNDWEKEELKCLSPILVAAGDGFVSRARCGQCTPCRIFTISTWTLRNYLECRTSLCSNTWTLTIADSNMDYVTENIPRVLKTFWQRLRRSNPQTKGHAPIRYFGCLEFGGLLGRPHFHFLIFNDLTHNTTRRVTNRLLDAWPHGFVTIDKTSQSSIRYVVDYLREPDWRGLRSQHFMSLKPGIGSIGLHKLGEILARGQPSISDAPWGILIGNRTYPLCRWSKGQLLYGFRKAGGRFVLPTLDEKIYKKLEKILVEMQTPPHVGINQLRQSALKLDALRRRHHEQAAAFAALTDTVQARFRKNGSYDPEIEEALIEGNFPTRKTSIRLDQGQTYPIDVPLHNADIINTSETEGDPAEEKD